MAKTGSFRPSWHTHPKYTLLLPPPYYHHTQVSLRRRNTQLPRITSINTSPDNNTERTIILPQKRTTTTYQHRQRQSPISLKFQYHGTRPQRHQNHRRYQHTDTASTNTADHKTFVSAHQHRHAVDIISATTCSHSHLFTTVPESPATKPKYDSTYIGGRISIWYNNIVD